jgi:hypothetical protein
VIRIVASDILGTFAKLRRAIVSFVMSLCSSVRMGNSAPTGRIFMKFAYFRKSIEKIIFQLKSGKNKWYCT